MDCSSRYAMQRLVALSGTFHVALANDTDADRHGIVARVDGLMNPNHVLVAAIEYLFGNGPFWGRPPASARRWSAAAYERATARLGRALIKVPLGFKWFLRACWPERSALPAKKAGKQVFCGTMVGLDDGQGWADRRPTGGRAHSADRGEPVAALRAHRQTTRPVLLRAHRGAGDGCGARATEGHDARGDRDVGAGGRARAGHDHGGTGQWRSDRRLEGAGRTRLVCRTALGDGGYL
jgi:hypothetical protein